MSRLALIIAAALALAGCSDQLGRPKDQTELTDRIATTATQIKRSENGREQAQFDSEYQKLLARLKADVEGRKIENWICSGYPYAGYIDLTEQIARALSPLLKSDVRIRCIGNSDASKSNFTNEQKFELILNLPAAQSLAKTYPKIYENDKLQFSGVIKSLTTNSPSKRFDMEFQATKLELIK